MIFVSWREFGGFMHTHKGLKSARKQNQANKLNTVSLGSVECLLKWYQTYCM